jgi:hypothetical protein
VILNGANTVGCNGSTNRNVTLKRICEHTKRILDQKYLCEENERTAMNLWLTTDESISWHNLRVLSYKIKEEKECCLKKSFTNDNIQR